MLSIQSLDVVDSPELRDLLLFISALDDSDIPHRSKLSELIAKPSRGNIQKWQQRLRWLLFVLFHIFILEERLMSTLISTLLVVCRSQVIFGLGRTLKDTWLWQRITQGSRNPLATLKLEPALLHFESSRGVTVALILGKFFSRLSRKLDISTRFVSLLCYLIFNILYYVPWCWSTII